MVGVIPRRRLVMSAVVVVLVVAAIVGIVTLTNRGGNTQTATATTPATTATTTIPATTPATTAVAAPPQTVLIDLTAAVTSIEPHQIVSFPMPPPGDLHPTAYVATAPNNRIAVLDDVTGVVRFIDGTTRMDITQYRADVPTIGAQAFIANYFFVGPDDVLYVNESDGDTETVVAIARKGDSYVEVARAPHGNGDGTLRLGRRGVSALSAADPIMPYVGVDGRPSGATLDVDDLVLTSQPASAYTVQRAERTWAVTYVFPADVGLPPSDTCVLCASAYLGPGTNVVLVNRSPTSGGDLQTKLTVLSDQITTYDTDWNYVGVLGDKLLFDHFDQDSLDLGTVEI
jgi:hypothetical protein